MKILKRICFCLIVGATILPSINRKGHLTIGTIFLVSALILTSGEILGHVVIAVLFTATTTVLYHMAKELEQERPPRIREDLIS